MRDKLLGRSGLRVSELALGTMTFGPDRGWGADKAEQLVDNIGCVDVVLGPDELARLDTVSRIERGFPYDFITGGRESFMGKITDQVDDHRHTAV